MRRGFKEAWFAQRRRFASSTSTTHNAATHTIVLLRHGESIWNRENRFTGWCDVPLTAGGKLEATEAGRVLAMRGFKFDVAFTSELRRASRTCELCLAEQRVSDSGPTNKQKENKIPTRVIRSWELNERHYGNLQGLKKDDHTLIKKYGKSDIFEWRRSYDSRPPPIDAGHPFWQPPPAPQTESLRDCQERVEQYYRSTILPYVKSGAKVLVVAHANTIRAMVKVVDDISDEDIRDLRIPNSIPLLYRLKRSDQNGCSSSSGPGNLEPLGESDEWGFQGEYLTSWQRADKLLAVERSQKRVLQAVFRAIDTEDRGYITAAEFQKWATSTSGGKIMPSGSSIAQKKKAKSSLKNSLSRTDEEIYKEEISNKNAGMGLPSDPLQFKLNQKTLHFFRKHRVSDPHTQIDFNYFMALSAEFWNSRDHFRFAGHLPK